MTEQESLFNSIGEKLGEKSQMFGKPCYKVNKKAFVCFFQNAMVFKLTDEAHKEALSLDGSQLFDPSGKGCAMKEWVQVPFDYKDQWKGFAEKALEYVGDR
ncbi:hypothetical protein [Owenweeksia hongkongensis]|uniref:hypothetical protein n=1 Tax=Owenweeksia hongkongensis TaxID=253245 RepID=UPI003A948F71